MGENYNKKELLQHISYLESLLTSNNLPFQKLQKKSQTEDCLSKDEAPYYSPLGTSLEVQSDKSEQLHLPVPVIERYSRQMLLPEISYSGQQKIYNSRILVVGAGGIGTPALYYIAGAGFGHIGFIDGDVVEESNLHRQILHNTSRVGMKKSLSAYKTLKKFNPFPKYEFFEERLTVKNIEQVIKNYNIILDASDNALTRYLLNDAAIINKKILVSGSALGWEGQLTVFGLNKDDPCYRCLFPICPKNMMSCGEAGVVGMAPGIIGILEAMEAIKIALGEEGVISKEMLIYDGLRGSFKKVKLRGRQQNCMVCGVTPVITNIGSFDYENFVGGTSCAIYPQLPTELNLDWEKFLQIYTQNEDKKDLCLIDVRSAAHYQIVNLPAFQNIPLQTLKKLSKKDLIEKGINNEKEIYLMCNLGNASRLATEYLKTLEYPSLSY